MTTDYNDDDFNNGDQCCACSDGGGTSVLAATSDTFVCSDNGGWTTDNQLDMLKECPGINDATKCLADLELVATSEE